jgi:hypothetical protein
MDAAFQARGGCPEPGCWYAASHPSSVPHDFGPASSPLLAPQPPPSAGIGDMWAEVIGDPWVKRTASANVLADMEARRDFGIRKHGRPVQLGNQRDVKADAYQEILDAIVYAHLRMRQLDDGQNGTALLMWRRIRNDLVEMAERVRGAP